MKIKNHLTALTQFFTPLHQFSKTSEKGIICHHYNVTPHPIQHIISSFVLYGLNYQKLNHPHNITTYVYNITIKSSHAHGWHCSWFQKIKGVVKINIQKTKLSNFKSMRTLRIQGFNLVSCDALSYLIHTKFKLLPLPHEGMRIHAMACHMKCDWIATILSNQWSLRNENVSEVNIT